MIQRLSKLPGTPGNKYTNGESGWIQIIKVLLLAISECGYTWELCDGWSRIVVFCCAVVAGSLAGFLNSRHIRFVWIMLLGCALFAFGMYGAWLILNGYQSDMFLAISGSRMLYYGAIAIGMTLLLRSLALRYQIVRVLEAALCIGALVFVFFSHRDMNLQNPQAFADWAYGSGRDPIELYRYMGIGASFLALVFWLGRARLKRVTYAFIILLLFSLLLAQFGVSGTIASNAEDPLGLFSDNEDDKDKDGDQDNKGDKDGDQDSKGDKDGDQDSKGDKDGDQDSKGDKDGDKDKDDNDSNGNGDQNKDDNNGSGGGDSDDNTVPPNNPPTPVAVAVFYDEYNPVDGVFHFRQNVLSKYDGNHLVGSDMDADVISTFPYTSAQTALAVQSKSSHQAISTSMFLFKDHTHPPQVAMGQRVFLIDNPNPRMFVTAYAVESLGLTVDVTRFLGRKSIPKDWSDEKKAHYLAIPDDPRYKALSDIIVRNLDPRFYGEDVAKAIQLRAWLEHYGYYTLKQKYTSVEDPVAEFLFGTMRGYCVHFAHSLVYLLRSQGIAARVAIGYAVDNQLRGSNSAVVINGDRAHAWPEIHIDGVGWVTFDIAPENGDPQPNVFVDQSLESLFGELARNDKSGGKADEVIDEQVDIDWQLIWIIVLALLCGFVVVIYARRGIIILSGPRVRTADEMPKALRSVMYVWSLYGQKPVDGETLEHFASTRGDATKRVVDATLCAKLGGQLSDEEAKAAAALVAQAWQDAKHSVPWGKRIIALFRW